MNPHDFTLFIYNISLFPVIFFSVMFLILSILNLLVERKKEVNFKPLKDLPFISVQIPSYNDPVAKRCVERCLDFDYPKDKYEIIIADDSTNEETKNKLKQLSEENPYSVKYTHRAHRHGYKAGALKDAMHLTKGDIIVIFDADWIPDRDFLKKIVKPFSDPKVAIVQTRQGFYNKDTNLISRFASYVLMAYHTIIMPINNKVNCVFFCGTAGAIRRKMFDEVGGWNLNSITEDSDLTVRLLIKGYKTIYLDFETPSEVPITFESFIKQQMRWCYGNVRVFIDNASKILFKKGLTLKQRAMVIYVTIGNVIAPIIILMTIFGFGGWFIGEPELMNWQNFSELLLRVLLTAGFIVMGMLALHKTKQLKEFPYMVLSIFTIGLVLAVANSIAFFKAVFNKELNWYCTTKDANDGFV